MNDLIGHQIGPYRIEALIGRGGMANVYRAVDTKVDRLVALKILPPHFGGDADFVRRFLHEARSTVELRHPNIVRTYTAGDQDGYHYIAMEYMDGGSLQRRIAGDSLLDWAEVARIVAEIASALDHAHERQVIHRDLKPYNILFNAQGTAKLADFGIAKSRHSLTVTVPSMLIGTPSYMSPEQAEGKTVTTATDIWSLGVVVYQLLTGALPFAADTAPATLFQVVHNTPAPPSRMASRLPGAVDKAVARAMAKSPAARFATAGEFARALEAALGTSTVVRTPVHGWVRHTPTPIPITGQDSGPRHGMGRVVVGGGLLAALVLTVALAAFAGRFGLDARDDTAVSSSAVGDTAQPSSTDVPMPAAVTTVDPATDTPPATESIVDAAATSTGQPIPTATSRPTVSPAPTAPAANAMTLALVEPPDGASLSGAVQFRFGGEVALQAGEVFDVRVCKGDGCQPQFGITNTTDRVVRWSPNEGPGTYRWQVVVIDQASKQSRGRSSPVWRITISDGGGGQGVSGQDDDDDDGGASPVSTPR